MWRRRYLSKGDQLVLIKSVLHNLPVYLLSCRLVPVTVLYEIEKIIRIFLEGSTCSEKKLHLVSFEGLCLPFDLGSLGLKRLREVNLFFFLNGFGG